MASATLLGVGRLGVASPDNLPVPLVHRADPPRPPEAPSCYRPIWYDVTFDRTSYPSYAPVRSTRRHAFRRWFVRALAAGAFGALTYGLVDATLHHAPTRSAVTRWATFGLVAAR